MAAAEVTFDALGQAWRFKFGWGALCRLEERYDEPFARILLRLFPSLSLEDLADAAKIRSAALDLRASLVRDVMAASVAPGPITATVAEELIDELGAERVMDIIRSGVAGDLTSPNSEGGGAKPAPKKESGTSRNG